jgi:hypothetical protein
MKTNIRQCAACLTAVLMFLAAGSVWGWYEHPLLLYPVLQSMPGVAEAVTAKSLEDFVLDNEAALEDFLKGEELRFRETLDPYPPRPEALAFRATGRRSDAAERFIRAMRLRPGTPFTLYLHLLPGQEYEAAQRISPKEISTFDDTSFMEESVYVTLESGDAVAPLMVLLAGSDVPDYGADTGLFEDNDTSFGAEYGFGEQPFGNPNLEYGSQGPFHMGFYHESKILYLFGPFLKRTYPEYRIAQFTDLARFAFDRGEDYWGWRFLGWALHYLGDMSMPYHTAPLPGVRSGKIIWMNLKSILGFPKSADGAVQIVSNRHTVFEEFQWNEAKRMYEAGFDDHPLLDALRNPVAEVPWSDRFVRDTASASAMKLARDLDRTIIETVPPLMVDDPTFEVYGSVELARLEELMEKEMGPGAREKLLQALVEPMRNFSMHMRVLIEEVAGD